MFNISMQCVLENGFKGIVLSKINLHLLTQVVSNLYDCVLQQNTREGILSNCFGGHCGPKQH